MDGFKPNFRLHSFLAASVLPMLTITAQATALSAIVGAVACLAHSDLTESSLFAADEDPRTYEDNYGIFTSKVNVQALGNTIEHDFRPLLSKKCHWFAIWYLLRFNGCLDLNNSRINFCRQMKKWYGKGFSLNCLDNYAATCLTNTNWQTWEKEVFNDFEKNESEAIAQGRVSLSTAKDMLVLCKQFDPKIKEICFK